MTAPSLKLLAADVRQVWSPPGGRAWSKADVRIEKLLQAIEAAPAADDPANRSRLPCSDFKPEPRDHPFDNQKRCLNCGHYHGGAAP